jgi:outer membrane immunogenic protein
MSQGSTGAPFKTRSIIAGIALAIAVLAGPAIAAEPLAPFSYKAPPSIFSWAGFYLGVHVGTGEFQNQQTFTTATLINDNNYTGTGFLGGGQAGFNYQTGPWILGIELDTSWANLDGSNSCIAASPVALLNCHTNVDWLATAAARFGFAVDKTLIFAKGGGAFAHESYDETFFAPSRGSAHTDQIMSGWMFGAGVEYAFYGSWSAKAEYDFIDFGTQGVASSGLPRIDPQFVGMSYAVSQRLQLVKFGINYRFSAGP